jgi:hypothetical protein
MTITMHQNGVNGSRGRASNQAGPSRTKRLERRQEASRKPAKKGKINQSPDINSNHV